MPPAGSEAGARSAPHNQLAAQGAPRRCSSNTEPRRATPRAAPLLPGPPRGALPGEGGEAGALELHLPALAPRAQHLAQVHGGAVAQLPGEAAELVAAVAVRRRLRARQ